MEFSDPARSLRSRILALVLGLVACAYGGDRRMDVTERAETQRQVVRRYR